MTIVLNEELETLEPCMSSQSNIGRVLLQNISETMTELDPSNGALMPRLATSWEETDDATWRFHLREGVTFSDGTAFDAADVKHSVERTLSDQLTCEIGAKYFGGMEITATVVDEHTIDIASDPAQPILPLLMSTLTIVPSETPMEFTRDPVGTGPYELTEYNVGQDIILERRDGYWGGAPAVTKATYVFRSDDAVRAAMVQTGEADIAPLISQTDATNKATDFAYPNSETTYLRIDSGIAPLDDLRVRQALNMAVDREAFLGTLIPEDAQIATHMTVPSTLGADEDLAVPAYDPEAARALLEAAKADGVPVGSEILLVGRLGNFPNVTEVMEALQAMFADAGFNIKLQMVEVAEWVKYYSKPFAAGDTPAIVAAMHDNNRGDPVFSMYFKYACDGLQSGICDQELDADIAAATGTAGEGRADAWRKAFARVHDLSADVFLFHMVGFSRVSERLDFTPSIATNSELQLSQIGFK
ncbi:ABC transporter substrate-binding protein [Mangrovicoccus sp. HB161399]|uniref:ABC transporter substrate-binding protein n=1 Tax=Mangrovicoccus sp. HB161399 TaxID=2720392 RepID=UPI00352D5CBB